MDQKKILIGVAWPYANGAIHMGHLAGCYLPPDIFERYHIMKGNSVLMVSGSDEHGTPITVTAEKENVSPAEIAKRYHEINSKSLDGMGIFPGLFTKNHLFTETSTDNHKQTVQELFLTLKENGYIYLKEMTSPYCKKCQRFLPDRYIEGNCPHCGEEGARGDQCDQCGKTLDPTDLVSPSCKICSSNPEMRETKHFFLRLSAFQEKLLEYIADKDHWRHNTKRFTENWLRSGLKDRPITRDISWGIEIPLPGYEKKRIYVWFEAVTGYLSAAKEWASRMGQEDLWKDFWKNPGCLHYYFLGKDNIPFHSIIWPAMLMGNGGLNLPYDVVSNEYLHFKGEKLSKSRNNMVSIRDYLEHLPPDPLRYYITANMPENRDADFTWEDFLRRVNEELVATLGNFVHRVLSFTSKHYGEVPPAGELTPLDNDMLDENRRRVEEISRNIEICSFKEALRNLMELARAGNVYLDRSAPWKTVKGDGERCATSLHISLTTVKAIAVAGYPFMPHAMEKLWETLGQPENLREEWDAALKPLKAAKLSPPEILFKKLDYEDILPIIEGGNIMEKMDLRAADVLNVTDHPNAEKLYVLEIDIGEKKKLVAGLKPYYSKEELAGKQIIVVCNLKPAKLRGIESQGMLLAADDGKGKVSVLTPERRTLPGTGVRGCRKGANTLSFEEFTANTIVLEEISGRIYPVLHSEKEKHTLKLENGISIISDREMPEGSRVR